MKTLDKNNIYNILINNSLYYHELPNYKFVIISE